MDRMNPCGMQRAFSQLIHFRDALRADLTFRIIVDKRYPGDYYSKHVSLSTPMAQRSINIKTTEDFLVSEGFKLRSLRDGPMAVHRDRSIAHLSGHLFGSRYEYRHRDEYLRREIEWYPAWRMWGEKSTT